MSSWTFCKLSGEILGCIYSGDEEHLALNTPPDCIAIPGIYCNRRYRAVISDGVCVDVIPTLPARPADDEWTAWVWDAAADDWVGTPTYAAQARAVRAERDQRLAACDWVVARAFERGEPVSVAWAAYRAALRDITLQPLFPGGVDWPVAPSA